MARAVLALGSNLGDREGFLAFAVSSLSRLPQTQVLAQSQWRETEPVDVPEAFTELTFLNGVTSALKTPLSLSIAKLLLNKTDKFYQKTMYYCYKGFHN